MPYIVKTRISAAAPLLQSRSHEEPKLPREILNDYEKRTWRGKAHTTSEGQVLIPAIAPKRSLDEVAKYLGRQIPGKGKSTYTKHFEAGVQCSDDLLLFDAKGDRILIQNVQAQRIFVNSDGVRGSGKRVHKFFPCITDWVADASFEVWDDIITPDVFQDYLTFAGRLIGIGAFRVRNGGFCGRFKVDEFSVSNI